MDVFERFTAKASDPILEPMLREIPDPFNEFGSPPAEDAIFSILPPLSIMAPSPSLSQSSSHSGTPSLTNDILTPFTPSSSTTSAAAPTTTSSYAGASFAGFASSSWTEVAATQSPQRYTAADEWADAHSPPASPSPPRSPSPSRPPVKSRPSSPPNSKGHSRSESKLRSVLAVIDETHGGTVKDGVAAVDKDARGGWAIHGPGFPHASPAGADITPRTSTFYGEDEPHEQPDAVGVTS